jgi:hypothetical protein
MFANNNQTEIFANNNQTKMFALVLGMVFCSKEGAAFAKETAQTGTTSSLARDRARLLELEALGYEVVSASDSNLTKFVPVRKTPKILEPETAKPSSFDSKTFISLAKTLVPKLKTSRTKKVKLEENGPLFVEESKHCSVSFGRRGVQTLKSWLQTNKPEKKTFNFVFLDYIRFPPGYMETAYAPFFKFMLPELIRQNIVSKTNTQIICPNAAILQPYFTVFSVGITRENYPLYLATKEAYKKDSEVFGGIALETDFKNLNSKNPFVIL